VRKLVLAITILLVSTTWSWALFDDKSKDNIFEAIQQDTQDQEQKQGQAQGQDQEQGQDQKQSQNAFGGNGGNAFQGQFQGQSSDQGNAQTTNIGGDETKVTTAVWPQTPSTADKEEKTISSLFGSIGNNKTEEYIRLQKQMELSKSLLDQGLLTTEQYKKDVLASYEQLKRANKEQKLFGVLPIAERGCSVINACGLLNW